MKTQSILEMVLLAVVGAYIANEFLRTLDNTQANGDVQQSDYVPSYDPYAVDNSGTTVAPAMIDQSDKPRFSPRTLATSPQQMAKTTQNEGRSSTAYPDSGGNWTIGIGHLIVSGDGLSRQSVLTDAQIDALFAVDINNAENSIYSRVTVPLSQGEFDALVDFIFQFGDSKFGSSTLLRLLNQGNYNGAVAEFPKWNNVAGKANAQLTARRADNAATFLT